MRTIKIKFLLRVLLGLFYIVSAVLKLVSIDSFEVYLYSFGFLSLNLSFFIARLIISGELLLGFFILLGVHLRKSLIASVTLLFGFSLFIIGLIINKDPENCHCFGDAIQMSHSVSLVKNIFAIAISILLLKSSVQKIKHTFLVTVVCATFSLGAPFAISPPDNLLFEKYSEDISYNKRAFEEYLQDTTIPKDTKILCFFGTGCSYCNLAAKKISVITEKSTTAPLHIVFWGTESSIEKFQIETNTKAISYSSISPNLFLEITNGDMPVIFVLEKNKIVDIFNYRSLDEKKLLKYLDD